jgi:hypothetical protein
MKFIRLPASGDIKEVIAQAHHIILVTLMPRGTCKVHLDPAVHEVTDFVTTLSFNEVSVLLT